MTNLEKLKNMSIDALAAWLDKNGMFDNSPWLNWFAKKYCDNCESIKCKYVEAEEKLGLLPFARYCGEIECAYCELADESGVKRCRFFPELDDVPGNKVIIKMWLVEEIEE
jgi:hypothetical protein